MYTDLFTTYLYTHTLAHAAGKKSPVYGKWKEFYFVVQCKDRKLLFYEQESVSPSE